MQLLSKVKKISIAAIIISAALGVLFIAFPDKCITYISLALGLSLIAMGIAGIVNYFIDRASAFWLVMGIIVALSGVVVCLYYKSIISIVVIIFGIFLLLTGIFNIGTAIKVIASSVFFGWITLGLSVVTSVLGIVAITRSSALSVTIVQFVGVALIVYAVLDILAYFQVKQLAKNVKTTVEATQDIETDGVIVEETEE